MPCPRTNPGRRAFPLPDSGPRRLWLTIQLTLPLSHCSSEYEYLNLWTSCMGNHFCLFFVWRIPLSQTHFFEFMIVNMNGGQGLSLLEAKNHICANGGAQSFKSLLKQEQSLIAWPLSEALAISLPLAWRGGGRRSTRHSGHGLVMRSRHSEKSQKDLFTVSSHANEGHKL